jgi:hypothetical protein
VSTGYRPICRFTAPDGSIQLVGMCELEVVAGGELAPGQTGACMLRFAPGVDALVRTVARLGSELQMLEGNNVVGNARVLSVA